MGALADYAENALLEHIVGKTAFSKPTAYVALFTVAPTDSTDGTEVSGGGYARMATSATDWADAADGSISNATDFEWDAATDDWGSVVAAALLDAATSGNVLVYGTATAAKTIASGDQYKIATGNFTLSLD